MAKRPVDLTAVRRIEAKIDEVLAAYPELQEPNPERQHAFDEWNKEGHTMAQTATGKARGRPKTKEYVTMLARVPAELADLVKRYAAQHGQIPVSELIREGLEWRVGDGDPRGTGMYLAEPMGIREQVYNSHTGKSTVAPEQADNAGMFQEFRGMLEPLQAQISALTQTLERQTALGSNGVLRHTSMESDVSVDPGEPAPGSKDGQVGTVLDFDSHKYRLGKLCPHGHDYHATGQSLRVNNKAGYCMACNAQQQREARARRSQQKPQSIMKP